MFGWKIERSTGSGDYRSAITTPSDVEGEPIEKGAINGGIFAMGTHGINETFLELMVESIERSIERAVALGGKKVTEKTLMGGSFFFAIIQDPDGNFLGLWEEVKHMTSSRHRPGKGHSTFH